MNIVITDWKTVTHGDLSLDVFKSFGNVTAYDLTHPDQIAERIKDADIVLCNKTPMTADMLSAAPHLKYIGLFATGYNNIDIEYCKKAGITVCNAGSYSTNAVAQHTFALILEAYNKTSGYNQYVHDGMWKRSATFSPFVYPLNELAGKTLGIIGLGAIGKAVAKIANAFEMRVIAYNRSERRLEGVEQVSFEELLRQSDIVSVHCPLNETSRDMFRKETFAEMKRGALFINTARGGIVVEQDLYEALESGQLGGAGIDALRVEPMEEDCVLMRAKNCIMTPHIAWAPVETRQRLMGIVVANIKNYYAGTPTNKVN